MSAAITLTDELEPTVCPNQKCLRKIEKPILLSKASYPSPEKYHACPYCFTKLEVPSIKLPWLEKEKEELQVEPPKKEEKGYSKCGGYLGYLTILPKDSPIPRECLACPKVLDCAMKINDS